MKSLGLLLALALVGAACGTGTIVDTDASTPLATTSTTTTTSSTTTTTTTTTTLAALSGAEVADEVSIDGPELPTFGATPDPALGLFAPVVTGAGFDGTPVTIGPSDSFTVIMFLAHWCQHCRGEVEELGPHLKVSPPPDNVDVVSVSTGVRPAADNYPPSAWLTPDEWPVPVLVDTEDSAVGSAFGLTGYPYWVVIDPEGIVLGRTAGSLPLESVEALFENLAEREG